MAGNGRRPPSSTQNADLPPPKKTQHAAPAAPSADECRELITAFEFISNSTDRVASATYYVELRCGATYTCRDRSLIFLAPSNELKGRITVKLGPPSGCAQPTTITTNPGSPSPALLYMIGQRRRASVDIDNVVFDCAGGPQGIGAEAAAGGMTFSRVTVRGCVAGVYMQDTKVTIVESLFTQNQLPVLVQKVTNKVCARGRGSYSSSACMEYPSCHHTPLHLRHSIR